MNDYRAEGLKVIGDYSLNNAISLITKVPKPNDQQTNSVYGLLSANYDNLVFFGCYRKKRLRAATLPVQYRSFFIRR
ncbi:hypothetical protein [Chryseobacterium indoltheticum]|uniref:hypothetical protein n=1 Tax=Chryseobacterium indoltheticum TaxID=254 RepID=UPI003F4937D4